MMVPLEFSDQSRPLGAKGKKRNHAKREPVPARGSRSVMVALSAAIPEGGRHQSQPDQFSSGPRRHDPRPVPGIGQKEKDLIKRHGNPLLELNQMSHEKTQLGQNF